MISITKMMKLVFKFKKKMKALFSIFQKFLNKTNNIPKIIFILKILITKK